MKTRFREHSIHHRNYGCRIREYLYRDLKTVILENELLRISILVDKGTDIFEFLFKPLDLDVLWHSFNGIRSPGNLITGRVVPGRGLAGVVSEYRRRL
jgi:hypothetical protein